MSSYKIRKEIEFEIYNGAKYTFPSEKEVQQNNTKDWTKARSVPTIQMLSHIAMRPPSEAYNGMTEAPEVLSSLAYIALLFAISPTLSSGKALLIICTLVDIPYAFASPPQFSCIALRGFLLGHQLCYMLLHLYAFL